MKVCFLYHLNDENSRLVEDYIAEFKSRYNRVIETISLDTREGAELAKLYDIVSYPALIVFRDDGQLNKSWEGINLPSMDEVLGYLLN